ncbi:probable LRR receptor-like serine/threonine-protein kinase At1g07650 isoform X2 [Humulus lupulus]|uniref:probable LRR receptor-like serine/threonine-protein kinase At1g07650 isoform X2 n=1 Tax=Humulus lupulus TaxID=3486 RepID=UPI002B40EA54|nr:probable LRR receptor-like serine/threonine-protein kinase At1g07650 isoform X2 [Humulus lupulus]
MAKTNTIIHAVVVVVLLLLCMEMGPIQTSAQPKNLPTSEVKAIKEIAAQLNKNDWNFNDPCSNKTTTERPHTDQYFNFIICNCSISANVCHVQTINFVGQDLDGVLPPSVGKLQYLKELNLGQNYLSGTIPSEWASTKLETLVLSVNNLTGPIPSFLGRITTLKALGLESNSFSGTIPPEFGNLVNMETLFLGANSLNGTWPVTLTNLTKLQTLRISSNNFSGRLPDFFRSWKLLKNLEIQGSGFEGPIPSSLSVLNNLDTLRISDLKGASSEFPDLRNMNIMQKLMLRSCNIRGKIPEYLSTLTNLETLDLSFNRLEGTIPNFGNIRELSTIYLTSNQLTGIIPDWISSRNNRYVIDLSYNNFSEISVPPTCRENFNLFRSFSQQNNKLLGHCMNPCSKDRYSLHINCGGKEITLGNIKYQGDEDPGGGARFFHSSPDWGFSSTGDFWNAWSTIKDYISNNASVLKMKNSELYTAARLSPLSLTYHARCLANGPYTVKLHFAEIVLRDNRSYYSVGSRMFDVYVQGKLELKDFNIEKEAEGVDKDVIRKFKTTVTDKTLDIRFQYAGKGTTNVPRRGIYGSLVSAISLESGTATNNDLIWTSTDLERGDDQPELHFFELDSILMATNKFSITNKLGQGGFGPVYKGQLHGKEVAVKRLSSSSSQGYEEFRNEIILISKLQHRNLVKLIGCCIENEEKLLIYEFMLNKSLDTFIFDDRRRVELDWAIRFNIIDGIARGLVYLHRDSSLRVIHRDLKASNILLDEKMTPKISDFGLARIFEGTLDLANTHRVVGTIGYMSPEYALRGIFSEKSDVFSYGVLLLEIISGKKNTSFKDEDQYQGLIAYSWQLWSEGRGIELVDEALGESYNESEALKCIHIGLLCIQDFATDRPSMAQVASMLSNQIFDQPQPKQPVFTFQASSNSYDPSIQSGNRCSVNEATVSIVEPR